MNAQSRVATLLVAISLPTATLGQQMPQTAPSVEPTPQNTGAAEQVPVCGPVVAQQQPGSSAEGAKETKQEVPVAKEVGAAAAGTAGQIGGAVVAGPIGAAVGGVIASKVGEAVGGLVKKKKKKPDEVRAAGEQRHATAQASSPSGNGQPQIVCVEPTGGQQPQP